ncbi:hypothetical protein KSD_13000 [Ktedonobacter sp. SOSP1-85]|nr:hypothetical protein KSD_13000 [Ktedonobacter sp. SOSP1-85]
MIRDMFNNHVKQGTIKKTTFVGTHGYYKKTKIDALADSPQDENGQAGWMKEEASRLWRRNVSGFAPICIFCAYMYSIVSWQAVLYVVSLRHQLRKERDRQLENNRVPC